MILGALEQSNFFGPSNKVLYLKKLVIKSGVRFLILFVLVDAILLNFDFKKRTSWKFFFSTLYIFALHFCTIYQKSGDAFCGFGLFGFWLCVVTIGCIYLVPRYTLPNIKKRSFCIFTPISISSWFCGCGFGLLWSLITNGKVDGAEMTTDQSCITDHNTLPKLNIHPLTT